MVLKYVTSKNPGLLEPMVVKIYEAQNTLPGAEVYTEVIPEKDINGIPTIGAGHQVSNVITANGLDKVVHVVTLYSQSGSLLYKYNAEPKEDIVTVFDPIKFKVGDGGVNTPAANQSQCYTPELAGLAENEYLIHRNGYGILFADIHYELATNGYWNLIQDLDVFGENEEFIIQRLSKTITTVVNDSVVAKWFGGFIDVIANTSYDNTHLRKLIRLSGSAEYTFNSTVPIGYGFCFQHFGSNGTAAINFLNAPVKYAGNLITVINLPQYSQACFSFDGEYWNIVYLVNSSWNNDPVQQPNQILAGGEVWIGDVAGGDPNFTVNHNLGIAGEYRVMLSIKSNNAATYYRDNKIGLCWWHSTTNKANQFHFSLQELSSEVQNITVSWIIIKA